MVQAGAVQGEDKAVVFTEKAYLGLLYRLRNGYCCFCYHRRNVKPCALDLVPVDRQNRTCKHFKMWRVDVKGFDPNHS